MVYYFTKKRSIVLCVLFFLYCNVALFFLLCESQFLTKYSSVRYHIMKVSRYFALDTKTEFRKGYCEIRISSLCAMLYMNYPRHEEPHKVPLLIILSEGCYAQFPVLILPPMSCMLAGARLAVIDSDLHRGDETILNFATVC